MKILQNYWAKYPLQTILIAGFLFRFIAAIFSGGFGMHDDHFLIIEASQSWVDGTDYNNWLPQNQANPKPEGHNFFYVGLHYLFFRFVQFLGLTDVWWKMFLVRLIHAIFSMLTVFYGYKISQKLYDDKIAKNIGLILSLVWFMPFLSVRNLVEVVSIPILMGGIWYILKNEGKKLIHYFVGGLILGMSFSIRYQCLLFVGGVGLALLLQKKWREMFLCAFGVLISILLLQGIIDFFIWGKPFVELWAYIIYNIEARNSYGTDNWLMYITILSVIFFLPLGFFLMISFFRNWRKNLIIFLPTFIFWAFHTVFPNKQERFIFSIIPFYLILGFGEWILWTRKSNFWLSRKQLIFTTLAIFWILNSVLLPIFSVSYSKRARVESMIYLSKYKFTSFLTEDSNSQSANMLPRFYLNGQWIPQYDLIKPNKNLDSAALLKCDEISSQVRTIFSVDFFKTRQTDELPDFVLFIGEKNLANRVEKIKKIFPNLKEETIIEPSLVDSWLYQLNSVNKNLPIYIYKTQIRNLQKNFR